MMPDPLRNNLLEGSVLSLVKSTTYTEGTWNKLKGAYSNPKLKKKLSQIDLKSKLKAIDLKQVIKQKAEGRIWRKRACWKIEQPFHW